MSWEILPSRVSRTGARLLEDFLLHEMLEAALFGHDRVPGDVLGLAIDGVTLKIHDANTVR